MSKEKYRAKKIRHYSNYTFAYKYESPTNMNYGNINNVLRGNHIIRITRKIRDIWPT